MKFSEVPQNIRCPRRFLENVKRASYSLVPPAAEIYSTAVKLVSASGDLQSQTDGSISGITYGLQGPPVPLLSPAKRLLVAIIANVLAASLVAGIGIYRKEDRLITFSKILIVGFPTFLAVCELHATRSLSPGLFVAGVVTSFLVNRIVLRAFGRWR